MIRTQGEQKLKISHTNTGYLIMTNNWGHYLSNYRISI
jgi:hypothetical protein